MKYELRRLSFGETLGEAFNLYFNNFAALFLISFVSSIPAFVHAQLPSLDSADSSQGAAILGSLIATVVTVVVSTLATALTIELISKKYLKQHDSFSRYLQNVRPFILPVIGLSMLTSLIIGLGFLLFVIPGMYFLLGLFVATQVLIVERSGVVESIKRSFDLTKGRKIEILGLLMILAVIIFAGAFASQFVIGMFSGADTMPESQHLLGNIFTHLVEVLITPFSSCVGILVYFNLRIEKEGFALEHLVEQFASHETGEFH